MTHLWPICLPKLDFTRVCSAASSSGCFAVHGTQLITVTSAISLLVGASLGEIAGGNTARFGALAAGTALLVALIAFIAWLVKAGVIVNFISESVMTGFKCGVALFLASTQLPKLFGIHGAHGDFWVNSGHFFKHLHETNPTSLLLGVNRVGSAHSGKDFFKKQTGGSFRCDWRHCRCVGTLARYTRRETSRQCATGIASARNAGNSLG